LEKGKLHEKVRGDSDNYNCGLRSRGLNGKEEIIQGIVRAESLKSCVKKEGWEFYAKESGRNRRHRERNAVYCPTWINKKKRIVATERIIDSLVL
jgi:hypothetical protein